MKIGVSGASGQLGGAVVEALRKSDVGDIIAITRTPESVAPPVEGRLGDYDKAETLLTAYADLDRLLIIPSPDLRPGVRSTQIVTAVDAAISAGVDHIFLVSATGARKRVDPEMGAAYWAGEQRLMKSNSAWTILRLNYFAETLAEQAEMAAKAGHLPGLNLNRIGFISRGDGAAACAGALATDGHIGAIYNLTGPQRLDGAERAELLSEFAGQRIEYALMSEDALRGAMKRAGLPAFVIDAVTSMQNAQANGDYDIVTGDVEKLAGRPPRDLSEVLQTLRTQLKTTFTEEG